MKTFTYQEASSLKAIEHAKELLVAYGNYMYHDLGLTAGQETFFQDLDRFPGKKFTEPDGWFCVAYQEGLPLGCGGLARFDEDSCEMKRLYVPPQHRGLGVGEHLCDLLLEKAREYGYRRILLDTNREMAEAVKLYRKKGFREIAPYCENENPNPLYFEYKL